MLIILMFLGMASGRPRNLAQVEHTEGVLGMWDNSSRMVGMVIGIPHIKPEREFSFPECGRTHSQNPRIVNGGVSAPGQIPWQVRVC